MMRQTLDRVLLPLMLGCSAFLGCTGATPCSVSGNVTFDGQPLEKGNIKFEPVEDSEAASGSATIENGKYRIPMEQGMSAGKYQASVTATKASGRQVRQFDSTTATMPEIVQFIPERYNRLTELKVEFPGGESTQDFQLSSKP